MQKGKLVKEDLQETIYFDCKEDLRIQKNNFYSKIWMKKGKLHDEKREEIEIKFDRDEFDNLLKLFIALGYGVDIRWLRNRFVFDYKGVKVCLDDTKGYAYIIELESRESDDVDVLKRMLNSLDVAITPKEEFEKRYSHYQKNWKSLI